MSSNPNRRAAKPMLAFLAWIASVGVLIAGALHQGRRESKAGLALVAALAGAFFLSLALAFLPPPRWFLAAPEFLVIALAARIWNDTGDERARVVAFIGLGKLGLRFLWSQGLLPDHTPYAATLNGAFMVQCLVAGGMLDGIGSAIADRFRAARRWAAGSGGHGVA